VKGLPRNFDLIDLLSSSPARDHKQQPRRPARSVVRWLRSHVHVASADAPEPRAACEHHRAKKVEMWCKRDGVASGAAREGVRRV
jgi:hypothetical protein